jgi:hypothetical protein
MLNPSSKVSEQPQSPDPLGRRSLYWATGAAAKDRSRQRGRDAIPLGKHALYSQLAPDDRRARADSGRVPGGPPWARIGTRASGALGPVVVDCSKCGARSEVGVAQFIALHLPVWLWRPGRGYARLMTCPACRRRAWLSASWRPWEH